MSSADADLLKLYVETDAVGLAALVRRGEVSPAMLVEAAATLIDRVNPSLNAVIYRLFDYGRAMAAEIDREAPLAGVPYLAKNLASMWRGTPQTNGSRWLKGATSPADDLIAARLRRAGVVLVGSTNSPENGWSLATEPAAYGATANPWKPGLSPGGSSGGAAAAVAARLVPIAEASDAAGSIRVPAACCGLVGLKPSRGRISLAPAIDPWAGMVFAFCVSGTVRDTAAYLDAVAGAQPGEPYALPLPATSWLDAAGHTPARGVIGFTTKAPDGGPVDTEIQDAVLKVARTLEQAGHRVEPFDLPYDGGEAWERYALHAAVQNAGFVEAFIPVAGRSPTQEDLEPISWALYQRGRSVSATDYVANLGALRQLGCTITTSLARFDAYITPVLTQPTRPIGYLSMSEPDLDRYNAKWADSAFMFPFNVSGLPAMSLPLHWSVEGLPIGVQLVGRMGDEAGLLALASELEAALPWRDKIPPMAAVGGTI